MTKTNVKKLFNIEYPIFQGGMAWVSDAELAAAVSNAGGLGIIAGMNLKGDELKSEIKKCKKLTKKPFGVNVMLMSPYIDEVTEVVCDEKVEVLTTGAGDPSKYMHKWLENDIKVVPVVASVALAKMMEKRGATAIIAEGCESGGHVGEITTFALLPQVCDSVDIPVIAAGGIFDGRSVVAAFALGAQGVQLGTRFLCAKECNVSESYKNKIILSKDIDTIVIGRRIGHATRVLKNEFSRYIQNKEYDLSDKDLENKFVGALKKSAHEGDVINGSILAGQVAAMVKKEQTCKEIITEIFFQVKEMLKDTKTWINLD